MRVEDRTRVPSCRKAAGPVRRGSFSKSTSNASRKSPSACWVTEFQEAIATEIGKSKMLLRRHYRPRCSVADDHLMDIQARRPT